MGILAINQGRLAGNPSGFGRGPSFPRPIKGKQKDNTGPLECLINIVHNVGHTYSYLQIASSPEFQPLIAQLLIE